MLDIKSFDEKEHKMLTGMSNSMVLRNAEYLAESGKLYEVRTVIVPGLLDNHRNVCEISSLIAKLDSKIRYKIIKFRPIGVLSNMKDAAVPSDELMKDLKKAAVGNGCENVIVV
jgi:pyruvate-formate lyase-activating enzyme